jgi:hypothetical protein
MLKSDQNYDSEERGSFASFGSGGSSTPLSMKKLNIEMPNFKSSRNEKYTETSLISYMLYASCVKSLLKVQIIDRKFDHELYSALLNDKVNVDAEDLKHEDGFVLIRLIPNNSIEKAMLSLFKVTQESYLTIVYDFKEEPDMYFVFTSIALMPNGYLGVAVFLIFLICLLVIIFGGANAGAVVMVVICAIKIAVDCTLNFLYERHLVACKLYDLHEKGQKVSKYSTAHSNNLIVSSLNSFVTI